MNHTLLSASLMAVALGLTTFAASQPVDLSNYYVHLQPSSPPLPEGWFDKNAIKVASPPLLTGAGGSVGNGIRIDFVVLQKSSPAPNVRVGIFAYEQSGAAGLRRPCRNFGTFASIPQTVFSGQKVIDRGTWYYPSAAACGETFGAGPYPSATLQTIDEITFHDVKRRTARDGGQYDASPMVIERNGVPWMTYHWGYRMGTVAFTSNWNPENPANLADWPALPNSKNDGELVALPPPWIEEEVVEYVNRVNFPAQPDGQYFYAVRAEDKTLLDSIPAWQRSGKSFKSGGYVSACRFYGGKNGGPNTHFYSADDNECAALKAILQLSYEGQTFAVNVPLPGVAVDAVKPCPTASKPLYRVYNNASASNGRFVSNHRYLTERADVATVVAQGWVDEGHVMCVPN